MRELSFSFGTAVSFAEDPRIRGMGEREVFVFDANTRNLFGEGLGAEKCISIAAGEKGKGWESVEAVMSRALDLALGRDDWVTGIGGGVVTDVAAFAASLYLRGCRLRLVPTTLLAMVDAALGGKTGINYSGYKNMVGTFYPAAVVEIRTAALTSLSDREYANGLAELVKTSLLCDAELYDLVCTRGKELLARDRDLLGECIERCVAVKGGIVEQDPRETGIRAHLNLGHTFAHGLEAVAGFGTVSHGEAVAWGIARALDLGSRMGLTPADYRSATTDLLREYGYVLNYPSVDGSKLVEAMGRDKKRRAGRLRFVLQRGPQDTVIADEVDPSLVLLTLAQEL